MTQRKNIIQKKIFVNPNLEEIRKLYNIEQNSKDENDLNFIFKFINYINLKIKSFKIIFFRISYNFESSNNIKLNSLSMILSTKDFGFRTKVEYYAELIQLITKKKYIFTNINVPHNHGWYINLKFNNFLNDFPILIKQKIKPKEYEIFSKAANIMLKNISI